MIIYRVCGDIAVVRILVNGYWLMVWLFEEYEENTKIIPVRE
jgi:hypothetical protein